MRLRHRGNTAAFRETAGPGEVGLDDVDRTAGDQLTKAVEPDLGLVAGDRRGERIGDHGTARDVVGRDRLLDPIELMGLERAAHLDREGRAPGAIDIDHQLRLRSQCTAHCRDPRDVLLGLYFAELGMVDQMAQMGLCRRVAPDLHLHALEAAGAVALGFAGEVVDRFALLVEAAAGVSFDPVAAAAEKTVERQFGDLAGDVPERDVDAADCIHNDAAPPELSGPREHLLPQPLDQQRVLADQHRPQHLLDNARGGPTADPGLTDPGHPLVGLDLDQQAAAPRLHAAGAAIGRLAAIGERYRADIDDLHDFNPRSAPSVDANTTGVIAKRREACSRLSISTPKWRN